MINIEVQSGTKAFEDAVEYLNTEGFTYRAMAQKLNVPYYKVVKYFSDKVTMEIIKHRESC